MNRLTELFKTKQGNLLSIYFSAGFPALNDTVRIIETLQNSGVDLIEIGIPYSDPLADGPTIQRSSEIALKNGMTINTLFEQLKDIRKTVHIPLLLMGYVNPVMQYGIEHFCDKCSEIGIDGLILPDLPMDEYLNEYAAVFQKNKLSNIFLVTPQSGEERIKLIDEKTNGFIYLVSSNATTGKTTGISDSQVEYFNRIKSLGLKNPTMVGFGISDKASYNVATAHSNGAIIGSAFIKALENTSDIESSIRSFVKGIRD